METVTKTTITVQNTVNAPVDRVWVYWTSPEHIVNWCAASDDWHTPWAENDLRAGGRFISRMEAKDGSIGFDFGGVYDEVKPNKLISYTMDDGRKVIIHFNVTGTHTTVEENFEAEDVNSVEMQRGGWQAILDNFKRYVEGN
jgi:uncharacterized protein YndB with AHSA1/START domain